MESSTPRCRWRTPETTTRSCRWKPSRRSIHPGERAPAGPRLTGFDLHPLPEVRDARLGRPAAQIAMIKRECVDEEGWSSEEPFRKTLAVYQVLPGPGGARAVRVLRAAARRQARRLPGGAWIHAPWVPPDAGALRAL